MEFGQSNREKIMDLHKSYQLTRFRGAIVMIILAILVGIFLRFTDIIQASMEEVSVEINLISMQQMIRDHNYLEKGKDMQCKLLDDPELFLFASNPMSESKPDQQRSGSWEYDSKKHQLTYAVRSTVFFRSKFGQKIVLDLYCNKGVVLVKKNPFQWCHNKGILGCKNW